MVGDTPRRDGRMTARSRTLWTPLRHRDFRYLVTGQAISQTGDWLYNVALIVFVYDQTRSGAWVAAAGIVRLLPYTLFGALGGMVADRWSRRRVMIVSDVTRAMAMVGLALVAAAGGSAVLAIGLAGLATTLAVAYSLRERRDADPGGRGGPGPGQHPGDDGDQRQLRRGTGRGRGPPPPRFSGRGVRRERGHLPRIGGGDAPDPDRPRTDAARGGRRRKPGKATHPSASGSPRGSTPFGPPAARWRSC